MRKAYQKTLYASYLGYVTQAVVNNLAPLLFVIWMDQFALSLDRITFLVTLNFIVQLLVDLLAAKYVDRIGYRQSIIAAHIFSFLGLAGLALVPVLFKNVYLGFILAVVCYATGGGLIEVLISPIVEACPFDHKAAIMSLLHSFYCWGSVAVILLSTLFLFTFGKTNWQVLAILWSLLPLGNAFFFTKVPIKTLVTKEEGLSFKALFSKSLFWIFLGLMIVAGASEQAMSQWASTFAERGLQISKTAGDLAGPCMFALMMGLARMFYAKKGQQIDISKGLLASGILCVIAYGLAAFSKNTILSLCGCALAGLSVGLLWPGVFSLAAQAIPRGGTAMFALLALAGDLGCSSGPTLVGFVSEKMQGNLQMGLAAAIVFPLGLMILLRIYKKLCFERR